ncbi:MAG: spermidine synthase [Desulfobacterium sp.]|nr:spermidine synthase [Desulfobacterium sp.]
MYKPISKSFALKAALFATGCAGIVAEFVLSTLATYLVGNAIFQWTIVMSLMLFAMGIGSRFSRIFQKNLLDVFIFVEFLLSLICAMAAEFAYGLAAFTEHISLLIYFQALVIGCLIGIEIPLVTRLNEEYEELRINISGVMEKDYYGALLGGLLFAFLALPYLGLTYTPIILGSVNFLVASFLLWRFFSLLCYKKKLITMFSFSLVFLVLLSFFALPIIQYGEQKKYKDKVIYSLQTPYQKIVMTQWKEYYWLYINGQEQFSTYDEEKYHEPLVHPAMKISHDPAKVLVLGGGDGVGLREILKYPSVREVTLVDMDPAMTTLGKKHPILMDINDNSMNEKRVTIFNDDAARFLKKDIHLYGVIIIDLPDPDTVDLMHVYSDTFYQTVNRHLIRGGVMVTQATSPYFSRKAFLCIAKTIREAGFSILPYHNQIPTMGEWGWVLGVKAEDIDEVRLKQIASQIGFQDIPTRFLNQDGMISMIHFGKGIFDTGEMKEIQQNDELNPILYRYYLSGSWGMY